MSEVSLPSSTGWPVAIARTGNGNGNVNEIPKYYVWVFCHYEENYIPFGMFNTKEEADTALTNWKAEASHHISGAVLELSWREFVGMAVQQRLGKLAEALEKLGLKS